MLQLSQRPLTSSSADAELFVGCERELAEAERAIALGFNTYITGAPGSGKTSTLRQLDRRLNDQPRTFVSPEAAHLLLQAILGQDVQARDLAREQLPTTLSSWFAEHGTAGRARPRHLILLDAPSQDLVGELFGRGRDELWEYSLNWVVTGRGSLRPPADSFFEAAFDLPLLTVTDSARLLQRRAETGTEEEAETIHRLAETLPELLGPETPRNILAAARLMLLSEDRNRALVAITERRAARLELSDTAARVLALLAVTGHTYAGDERLLKEMGMTRNRMVQVFGELETAGLVASERVGKRKLYGPAPLTQLRNG